MYPTLYDRTDSVTRADLTDAERSIIPLVAEGLTNRQIADRVFVAPSTIHWHLKNIFRKLGIQNRTQLALIADELDAANQRQDA